MPQSTIAPTATGIGGTEVVPSRAKYGECGTGRGIAAGLDRAGLGQVTSRRHAQSLEDVGEHAARPPYDDRDDRRHPERDETDPGAVQIDAAVLRGEKSQRARPYGRHRWPRGTRVGQPARDCHRHADGCADDRGAGAGPGGGPPWRLADGCRDAAEQVEICHRGPMAVRGNESRGERTAW